jgi:phosphatidate cytidylyltransferase
MIGVLSVLLLLAFLRKTRKLQPLLSNSLNYTWVFFLLLVMQDLISLYVATWGWGILCFMILREYFSLVDLRIQDRLGIIASYLSIPFMMHFVHTNWYTMFIISIPVYGFLVVPFLISLADKKSEGAVYSIGVIDFGLLLFVFCTGHLAYLASYSSWMAGMLILNIALCDSVSFLVDMRSFSMLKSCTLKYVIAIPFTITLSCLLSDWTRIPLLHAVVLGFMIPALTLIGTHTIKYFETDLGISQNDLRPGRGFIIDSVKSIVYVSPIVFHYIRYFLL